MYKYNNFWLIVIYFIIVVYVIYVFMSIIVMYFESIFLGL